MSAPINLDNNATTRPLPAVVEAMHEALTEHWHNPSSVHRAGQAARHVVEKSRGDLATLIGAKAREITFTSGGTESIDLAIRGSLLARKKRVLVTDAVEHAAVRELAEALERDGVEVRRLPVLAGGVIDVDALPILLESGVGVVSIQWANNETGAIQPIERVHERCREAGVPLHVDATQWVGKLPTPAPVGDLMSFSPHKFGGPKGIGVLWARRSTPVKPLLHGAQELGRRGGTENVPGIAGAGAAAREAMVWLVDESERERLCALRDRFEAGVLQRCAGAVVNGPTGPGERLWNTTNIGFPRLEAEALLLLMSERGLWASAGAACSSGSLDPSPVLLAMGVPDIVAHGSVRFSLGRDTSDDEIERAIEIVGLCVDTLSAS